MEYILPSLQFQNASNYYFAIRDKPYSHDSALFFMRHMIQV